MRPYLWTPTRSRPSGSARLTLQHENAFGPFYKDNPPTFARWRQPDLAAYCAPKATPEPLTASGVKTGCKASQGQDRLGNGSGFSLRTALHDVFRMSVIPCIDNPKPSYSAADPRAGFDSARARHARRWHMPELRKCRNRDRESVPVERSRSSPLALLVLPPCMDHTRTPKRATR